MLSSSELIVCGGKQTISMCDLETFNESRRLQLPRPRNTRIFGCCHLVDDVVALSMTTRPYDVVIYDIGTDQQLVGCAGHSGTIVKLGKVSPDVVVSGSYDQSVRLWDCETGAELASHKCNGGVWTRLPFSPSSERVFFGTSQSRVHGWKVSSPRDCLDFVGVSPGSPQILGLDFDEKGQRLYLTAVRSDFVSVYSPKESLHPVTMLNRRTAGHRQTTAGTTPSLDLSLTDVADLFWHEDSHSVILHAENGEVGVIDVRNPSSVLKQYFVQKNVSATVATEILQVGEMSFVSVNESKNLSHWTIEGKVILQKEFDYTLYSGFSPYNSLEDGLSVEDLREEEIQRIAFCLGSELANYCASLQIDLKEATGNLLCWKWAVEVNTG